jgi:hypothetical protein
LEDKGPALATSLRSCRQDPAAATELDRAAETILVDPANPAIARITVCLVKAEIVAILDDPARPAIDRVTLVGQVRRAIDPETLAAQVDPISDSQADLTSVNPAGQI